MMIDHTHNKIRRHIVLELINRRHSVINNKLISFSHFTITYIKRNLMVKYENRHKFIKVFMVNIFLYNIFINLSILYIEHPKKSLNTRQKGDKNKTP